MDPLAGPWLAAGALLVLAGAGKLHDPAPLVRALRSLGLPGGRVLVRLLAAVEVLVGLLALTTGSRAAALAVAGSYAAFTGVVVRGLRRGGVLSSCGCFGRADTQPTRTHAAVTAATAAVALAVAARPVGPLPALLERSGGPALLLLAGVVALTAYLVLAVLPLLSAPGTPRSTLRTTTLRTTPRSTV